mmetsp:Transcript_118568/g.369333  ORF Transcript_118568/g.369333 Transcript_118568/m.369333 type:complete len:268 (+) Transcript_118568:300-1103(+)
MARRTSLPHKTTKQTLLTSPWSPDAKDSELREAKRELVLRLLAEPSVPGTRTRMTRSMASMLPKCPASLSAASPPPGSQASAQARQVHEVCSGKSAVRRPAPGARRHTAPSSNARASCADRCCSSPALSVAVTSPETRLPSSCRASTRARAPSGAPAGASPRGRGGAEERAEERDGELAPLCSCNSWEATGEEGYDSRPIGEVEYDPRNSRLKAPGATPEASLRLSPASLGGGVCKPSCAAHAVPSATSFPKDSDAPHSTFVFTRSG